MIKFCLYLFLFFIIYSCKSKKDYVNGSDSKDTSYVIDKQKILRAEKMTSIELFISEFLDSLTTANNEAELPNFLLDPQFDYRNRGIWVSPHNPISVRNEIISRVGNCKTLQLIILSHNSRFKSIPVKEEDIVVPLGEFSFYDLSLRRFEELNCR